ncbi:hypothetical protein LOTGIDRAFT_235867 [Lottia gigantea]|uniref:C-type lectin domain-containing protein n=1 Tax=Lottia gigantea TaxID=225164 RepID=V3ZRN0_LOTGI|nr:hypothetical protein LOTGIDRAFT_235867 [Lottia gigantea]ESO85210.1 hypothetical protein LOTGIDRAFT_235867 [Lottia gigantea]
MAARFILILWCMHLLKFVDCIDLSQCDGILQESEPVFKHGEYCYMFDTDQLYWDQAQAACRSRGGNLIQLLDSQTQRFTMSTAHSIGWGRKVIWIGASDRVREGNWVWVNGEKVDYKNWARGAPKKSRKRRFLLDDISEVIPDYPATVSDCVVMDIKRHGQWLDMPCHYKNIKHEFICQFELKHPTSPTTQTTGASTRKKITLTTTTAFETTSKLHETDQTTEEITTTNSSAEFHITIISYNTSYNISNVVNDTYDNDRQIDNNNHVQNNFREKIGLITGLTVLGVIVILVLSSVMVVRRKMKSKQKIELKDVIAFNNTVYNNGDEASDTPEDLTNTEVHIYHIPDEFNDKDVITNERIVS